MITFDIENYEQWRSKDGGIAGFIMKVVESVNKDTEFPVRITIEYGDDLKE